MWTSLFFYIFQSSTYMWKFTTCVNFMFFVSLGMKHQGSAMSTMLSWGFWSCVRSLTRFSMWILIFTMATVREDLFLPLILKTHWKWICSFFVVCLFLLFVCFLFFKASNRGSSSNHSTIFCILLGIQTYFVWTSENWVELESWFVCEWGTHLFSQYWTHDWN